MDENNEITPALKNREELRGMLPRVWIGYVIAAVFLASEFIPLPAGLKLEDGGTILPLIVGLAGTVFWLICIYQIHLVLVELSDRKYPNAPWKAVLFHLIPLYSLYWIFKWPNDAADFLLSINAQLQMPKYLVGIILLAGLLVARFFDGALGLAIVFSGLLYLTKNIQKAIDSY